ncbi:MAG: hypothetical protein WAM70_06470 [Pyrinomonadaceae bacterium]
MLITRQTVAERIASYLHHELSLSQLVDWAEGAMMEGEFDERDIDVLKTVVSRLGLADVRAFGLEWDDCERLLQQLGYSAQVEIVAA